MAILDQWGNPVSSKALSTEAMGVTVTGIRDTFDDFVASNLTPARMSRILRDAASGEMHDFLTLAEEMEEIETQYGSVLSTRKRAIGAIEPQIDAASDAPEDQKIADAVREHILAHPGLSTLITDMLDGLGKGYAVVEIKWQTGAKLWTPADFEWHDPRLFQFDRETRKILRKRVQGDFNGAALEPYKFIQHMPRLKSGIPARNGLARLALWVFLLKTYALKDWAAFLEVHGMPLRLGKYGPLASNADKRILLNAVRNLGSDAAAIIPREMEIEFVETKGFSEKPFEGMALYLDKAISKAVIGQTMTTDASTGGLAQAKVHETVRQDIKEDDAKQIARTLMRDLIIPFVTLNFGARDRYPQAQLPVSEPEDYAVLSDALSKLVPLGLKVQMSEVRDRFGFADPEAGAELLGAPAAPDVKARPRDRRDTPLAANAAHSGKEDDEDERTSLHLSGCPCCGAAPRAFNAESFDPADPRDALINEAMEAWEPDLGPMIGAITQAAAQASSFEAFETALNAIAASLPTGDLATRIAVQTMKARGIGESADDTGSKRAR